MLIIFERQFAIRFISFFTKLTGMIERLANHLWYLNAWAKTFQDSEEVQNVCPYTPAAQHACKLMFPGWTSFRVFLLTTWSSFEAEFAEIGVRLDDRMPVVVCTAAVEGYKRVQVEARIRAEAAEGNNSPPPRNLRRISLI